MAIKILSMKSGPIEALEQLASYVKGKKPVSPKIQLALNELGETTLLGDSIHTILAFLEAEFCSSGKRPTEIPTRQVRGISCLLSLFPELLQIVTVRGNRLELNPQLQEPEKTMYVDFYREKIRLPVFADPPFIRKKMALQSKVRRGFRGEKLVNWIVMLIKPRH